MREKDISQLTNQKSQIKFIRNVAAPKNSHQLVAHTTTNLRSMKSINMLSSLLIILQKYNQHSLNLLFNYNEQTRVEDLNGYIKSKINTNCIYLSSGNLNVDYFLTLFHRCVAQLQTNKIYLSVHNIQIQDRLTLKSIQVLKCIGAGGFSKVLLARVYGIMTAIKVIDKDFIFKTAKQSLVENEKAILQMCQGHPFITKLYFSFQTARFIVFGMQFCTGGELFHLLRKVKKMKQEDAKFYFLQTLMAIQFLHANGILYRDLKPQNIIIDADGHLRLADFGLSKIINRETTYSFCGSAEYISPEMLLKKGHSYQVDYYCLGALIYELVTGLPPYYTHNQVQLFSNILNNQLTFPSHANMSDKLKAFLRKMLQKQPSNRYQSVSQILRDPWVSENFNKDNILNKKIIPPYSTDIFKYNFDDSQFGNMEAEIIKQIKEEAEYGNSNACDFDNFYYESPQIISVKNAVQARDYHNFVKMKSKSKQDLLAYSLQRTSNSLETSQVHDIKTNKYIQIQDYIPQKDRSIRATISIAQLQFQKNKSKSKEKRLQNLKVSNKPVRQTLHKQFLDKPTTIYTNKHRYWPSNSLKSFKVNNVSYIKSLQRSYETKINSSHSKQKQKSLVNSKQKYNSLDKVYFAVKKMPPTQTSINYMSTYKDKYPISKVKKCYRNLERVNFHYGALNKV